MNPIVVTNVTETLAPIPATLQNMGAWVSHGGTDLVAGTYQALTAQTSLAGILTAPAALTSITWSGSVVTVTTTAPHGYTNADVVNIVIAGVTPVAYNGTFSCTITGASTFTYALASNPGAESVLGTWQPLSAVELTQMNTTWWAQNGILAPYVLELGPLGDVTAIAALATYLAANPNINYVAGATGYFYHYMVPRSWAAQSTFVTLANGFTALNKMTYFDVTTTNGTYTSFAGMKSVFGLTEASNISATEFDVVAAAFEILDTQPSGTNRVPPLTYRYLNGVTNWAPNATPSGVAAGVNYVGTGAEGGISLDTLVYGTTMDAKPWNYYYAIDWATIQGNLAVSNAVINGSNNTQNPLYYDQEGINTLQSVLAQVYSNGVGFGIILGQVIQVELDSTTFANNVAAGLYLGNCVINAIPFQTYASANPSNYIAQIYGGFEIAMTPLLGFRQIIINLNAVEFA